MQSLWKQLVQLSLPFLRFSLITGFSIGFFSAQAQTNYQKFGLPIQAATPPPAGYVSPTQSVTSTNPAGQNDDIRLLPSNNHQAEVHISISQLNQCQLIASANTYTNTYSQGYYTSDDGGLTWQGSDNLPNSGRASGDPSTAFDAANYSYIATIAPNNDGYLVQSASYYVPFGTQVRASGPTGGFDKEMIAADNCTTSPYVNTLYGAWTNFSGAGTVEFNRSTDRGQTFSIPIVLKGSNGIGQGTNVQTGPNGEVYVCWADYGTGNVPANGIGFVRSTDRGISFTPSQVAFGYSGIRKSGPDPLFNNTRVNDFPAMAVDKSKIHPGRIYIVYPTKENGTGKAIIQVRRSDDKGTTWSLPVTASIPNGRQNWFPWIAVDDKNGDVSVAYYSFDGVSGYDTNTYVAYSHDGGVSFSNLKVSDVSHVTAPIDNVLFGAGYAGDYLGITAYGGRVYPVWSDNRSGRWQVYTSPLTYYSITGPSQVCTSTVTFQLGHTATWTADPPYFFTTSSASGTQIVTSAAAGATGTGTITARIGGTCGLSVTKTVQVGGCGRGVSSSISSYLSFPNPASSTLTIQKAGLNSTTLFSDQNSGLTFYDAHLREVKGHLPTEEVSGSVHRNATSREKSFFDVQLYNSIGLLVRTGRSSQGRVVLNVANLPNGLYTLHTDTETKHIQIFH